MYIKKLMLKTATGTTIRIIKFNKSVNIITTTLEDEQTNNNNVGKSTVIDLIDIALGASFEHKIKRFSDTLQQIVDEKKVYIELEITNEDKKHLLRVNLFNKKYFIDGEPKAVKAYGTAIRNLLFNDVPENIANRKLIPRFLILELPSNEERVIRYLDFNASTQNEMLGVYEATYAYFLNIKNKTQEISKLLKERNKQFSSEKTPKSVKINEAVKILQDTPVRKEGYGEKNEEIKKYQYLVDEFQSLQLKKELLEEESKSIGVKVDDNVIRLLSEELSDLVPDVQKAFDKIYNFNQLRENNRKKYLKKQLLLVDNALSALNVKLSFYRQRLNEYINFSDKKIFNFDKYNEELFSDFKQALDDKIVQDEVKITISEIEGLFSDEVIDSFNLKLSNFTKNIIGVPYHVKINPNLSPKKRAVPLIFPENQGSGTGRLHQLAFAFTAAIISINGSREFPRFILQDINEVTDEEPFEKMFDIAVQNNIQYITPILSSKLSDDLKKRYPPVLTLSNDDMLFEPKISLE
ncbi:hypothetical protein [Lactococcus petauri]|nr:hypothetical protein [Lactococcus petauri]